MVGELSLKSCYFLLSRIFLCNRVLYFYVQPEPVNGSTRPSSTIFGYTSPHSTGPIIMPRLRPPSVHTLRTPESSASEEEDRADLLGRNFHVPRPKSRSSIAVRFSLCHRIMCKLLSESDVSYIPLF